MLSGQIPTIIGDLTDLQEMNVSSNELLGKHAVI